ncbi:MAG: alginate export family protein [Verrucomicrobia bacterium]|nr:alginate export family protein [Verrucomicrobiota bacterium]
MKANLLRISLTLIVGAFSPVNSRAQTNPAAPPAAPPKFSTASPGLVNEWLREQSPEASAWDVGGQFRLRFEHKEHFAAPGVPGAADFRRVGGNSDNTYWLLREKFHLGYAPCPWFSIYGEARDSSSQKDDRNPNPEADVFDLHQALLSLGNAKEWPITAKVGRQEMIYGDERLIGASDWGNVGRVFDAAKLRFENKDLWVDGFMSRVVLVDDNNFNEANDYDFFSGVYASTRTLVPKQETQLYVLARNASPESLAAIGPGLPALLTGATPRDIYTVGLRIKSLPGQFGGWDYEAELAGQFGRFKFAAAGPSLDHTAFAGHVAGGYTWTEALASPRLGLEYNFATGDSDPADGEHGTFENLFPTNHKSYGYMDFVSWQNLHDARLAAAVRPCQKVMVTADYHAFWLADTQDFFYQVNGAARTAAGYGINPNADAYAGSEVDLVVTYAIRPRAMAQAGYGHFFVGDYVKDSLQGVGGASDADYIYVQLVVSF